MTRSDAPPAVAAAAEARAAARRRRDWTEADRLRAEIEAAGWSVVDDGDRYRLRPAHPADAEIGGLIRRGWSGSVPRRDPRGVRTGVTVGLVVAGHPAATSDSIEQLGTIRAALAGRGTVAFIVVIDGLGRADAPALDAAIADLDVVATGPEVGAAGCLDIVLRRATTDRVVVLGSHGPHDPGRLDRLVGTLDDPTVAIAGLEGLSLARLPRLAPTPAGTADAVSLRAAAFRLGDALALGEPDLGLRTPIGAGAWLSRVLLAASESGLTRRVAVLDDGETVLEAPSAPDPSTTAAIRRDGYRLLRGRA